MDAVKQTNQNVAEMDAPPPAPAMVVARWNSWARVWFPDTQESMWVNLDEVGYEAL